MCVPVFFQGGKATGAWFWLGTLAPKLKKEILVYVSALAKFKLKTHTVLCF